MLNTTFLNIGFIALTFLTLLYFYKVSKNSKVFLVASLLWLLLHGLLAYFGVYKNTDSIPPRFLFVILPTLFASVVFGLGPLGEKLREKIDLEQLHYIHLVRVVVEVVFLHGLYKAGYIARQVTFEGNNFDIIPGVTALFIALFVFRWKKLPKSVALVWNILSLGVLLFTISQALLSAPFPFQKFSFDQPTIAVLYFPFIWLPAFVAPIMIFAHFIAIKRLTENGS